MLLTVVNLRRCEWLARMIVEIAYSKPISEPIKFKFARRHTVGSASKSAAFEISVSCIVLYGGGSGPICSATAARETTSTADIVNEGRV